MSERTSELFLATYFCLEEVIVIAVLMLNCSTFAGAVAIVVDIDNICAAVIVVLFDWLGRFHWNGLSFAWTVDDFNILTKRPIHILLSISLKLYRKNMNLK